MLRPVIMVGCGGSGQKAVRYVRDSVDRHLRHAGWDEGFPRAWRFLGLDTLTTQEAPGEIPTMPETDYISVSLNHTIYSHVEDELLANYPRESESYRELIGWRPAPTEVTVPLVDGAGQMRAVGRIASIRSMVNVVRPKLQKAFTACRDGGPELQSVSESLGLKVTPGSEVPDPIVVVVGSMAGGTGAGIMLDVIDLIRRTDTRGAFPISIVFTPDIFGLGDTSGMSANGLAFMSELMASYWDQQLDRSTLIPPLVRVDKSGPHAVFMIGRKNTRGLDLGDSIHVYRAVGEALASWVTSSSVQEEVINFITVNWQAAAKENMGGYPFGHGFQPGVVSSFGAATLSIGRDRFFDYAVKLIMREMVFHLHEGHRRRSRAELGARAEGYSEQRIVEELLEENKKRFLNDCGLDERGEDANQIIDRFASQEMTKDEASRVRRSISQSLEGPDPLEGQSWKRRIKSQAVVAGNESQHRSSEWFRQRSGEWAPEIFQKILWVVSDYLGRYGLKTTARLVTATQAEVNEVADEVRNEASQDNRKAERLQDKADDYLKGVGSGAVTFKSKPVQDAIQSTAESIALKWRAHLRNEVAKSMEALTGEVLNPIAEQLDMGSYRVNAIVDSDSKKSNEVDISTWPQYGGGVPDSFLPSPLEFFIENPKSWPRMLDDLLDEADEAVNRSDSTYGPRNNVDAARYLLVSGDSSGIRERWSLPLIWAKSYDTEDPKWWPGNHPQIELTDDLELLKKRVEAWLKRPNSRSQRMFSEGLRGYLAETDSVGKMIPDHYERLIRFRQRLSEAKDKSQPLVEIDTTLSGVVHSSGRTAPITPLTEQFPFPGEHPARELVTEVFKDHPSVEFTDKDSESVMISSFVPSPLHPMVIPSFTLVPLPWQSTGSVTELTGCRAPSGCIAGPGT